MAINTTFHSLADLIVIVVITTQMITSVLFGSFNDTPFPDMKDKKVEKYLHFIPV